jgi:hypothetical protein
MSRWRGRFSQLYQISLDSLGCGVGVIEAAREFVLKQCEPGLAIYRPARGDIRVEPKSLCHGPRLLCPVDPAPF